jgi:hypothetical protein
MHVSKNFRKASQLLFVVPTIFAVDVTLVLLVGA